MNKKGKKFVLITNKVNQLIGVMSDGDIRRAIIKTKNIDEDIINFANKSPISFEEGTSQEILNNTAENNNIDIIPILKNGEIVDIYDNRNKKIIGSSPDTAIIMAGGKGTRLMPFTKNLPKPLLKINGIPVIQDIIEKIKKFGIKNFFVSVHYLENKIINFLGDGSQFGVNINYIKEKNPLGTAGSLNQYNPKIDKDVLIINGDIITKANFEKIFSFHKSVDAVATMCVIPHIIKNQFGVVNVDGYQITSFEEKPIFKSLINAGIYVVNSKYFKLIPSNKYYSMPELFDSLRKKNMMVAAYKLEEFWIDIGTPEDLAKAKEIENNDLIS